MRLCLFKDKKWLLVAMPVAVLLIAVWNPFKVTDPSNPRFDVLNFRIQNYDHIGTPLWRAEKEIKEALDKAFPKGTQRKLIESVFIDQAGYMFSDKHPANETAFRNMKILPPDWTEANYFVDYRASYGLIEEKVVSIRALYSSANDQLIEFRVYKFNYQTAPKYFVEELHDKESIQGKRIRNEN